MSENYIDLFLTSIIGGSISSILLIALFYNYLKSTYSDYKQNINVAKILLELQLMKEKTERMEVQVKALHGEFYHG